MIQLAILLTSPVVATIGHSQECAVGHWKVTFSARGTQSRSTFKGDVSVNGIRKGESIILGLRTRDSDFGFVSPPLTNGSRKLVWIPYGSSVEVSVFEISVVKMILQASDRGYDHGTQYWELKGSSGKVVLNLDSDPYRYLAYTPKQSPYVAFLLAGRRFLVENDDATAPWWSPSRKFKGPFVLKDRANYPAIGYKANHASKAYITLKP